MSNINRPLANNHISVDCVVLGFENEELKVLLVKREGDENLNDKLPGNLIYKDENLDGAAQRTLLELTGIKDGALMQFKSYGSGGRTENMSDVRWLERNNDVKIESIVTIAYFSAIRKLGALKSEYNASWVSVKDVCQLAFDHNTILNDAMDYLRSYAEKNPLILFELLPKKFTASELRVLCEVVFKRNFDVRNFQKKMSLMSYVVPLDEFQKNVSHRAARYYKFDKTKYNKIFTVKSFI